VTTQTDAVYSRPYWLYCVAANSFSKKCAGNGVIGRPQMSSAVLCRNDGVMT